VQFKDCKGAYYEELDKLDFFKVFGTNSRRLFAIAFVVIIGFVLVGCEDPFKRENDPYVLESVSIKFDNATSYLLADVEISGSGYADSMQAADTPTCVYEWKKDGVVIEGKNGGGIASPESGTYVVTATLQGNGNTITTGSKTSEPYVYTKE
jgi:hypothetical protein